jgi:glutathione peroxidase
MNSPLLVVRFLVLVHRFLLKEKIMQRSLVRLALAVVIGILPALASADEKGDKKVPPVLNFTMKSLDGKDMDLSQFQGKVVLVVNVASQCGYTPQYKGLQALHDKYAKDGLVVLGVPANEFGQQEPGTNEEIASFCEKNYGVKFPMLSKVVVKGQDQVPLYKYLTSKETDPKFAGQIKWNFTKFLISRDGEIVGRFEPGVKPESAELNQSIKKELGK